MGLRERSVFFEGPRVEQCFSIGVSCYLFSKVAEDECLQLWVRMGVRAKLFLVMGAIVFTRLFLLKDLSRIRRCGRIFPPSTIRYLSKEGCTICPLTYNR